MKNRHHGLVLRVLACSLAIPVIAAAHTHKARSSAATADVLTADTPSGPVNVPAPATTSTAVVSPTLKAPAVTAPIAQPMLNTVDYTAKPGDTWTKLAETYNTTRKKLKELNHLATDKLAPGQIIQVPAIKAHHHMLAAQPVQDFDVPASTFASCPVPQVTDTEEEIVPPPSKSAPVAQLVSPSEMAADQRQSADERLTLMAPAPKLSLPATALSVPKPSPAPMVKTSVAAAPTPTSVKRTGAVLKPAPTASFGYTVPTTKPASHGFLGGIFNSSSSAPASGDWGLRFLQEARALGDRGIEYNEDWRPPGEARAWTMDCSNTSRYLYKSVANINLPRTASDQYYYLHLQGKAWDVPVNSMGWADGNFLREHLQPGDLLFWENTYRPERQPPITHVMVFLGTNAQGQWIMAGSQGSRGGEHNRRNGGPDVYVFRPSQPCGGYTTWLGMVRHQGRFCAFGRPLEADPSKFALND
jgi:cell wall-associated NlpC family hydrolase/LysM repeat protein